MKSFSPFLLIVITMAVFSRAAPPLREVPDGTRLGNDMVTPIHIDHLEPSGGEDLMHIRLRDAEGYRVNLYIERGIEYDDDGEGRDILRLHLRQRPGAQGSEAIEPQSPQERQYLVALRSALEHFVPGWTDSWSMEGHRELQQLVHDLGSRQQARRWRGTPRR